MGLIDAMTAFVLPRLAKIVLANSAEIIEPDVLRIGSHLLDYFLDSPHCYMVSLLPPFVQTTLAGH